MVKTINSFSELGKQMNKGSDPDAQLSDTQLIEAAAGGAGGGTKKGKELKKPEKEDITANQERLRMERAKEIWGNTNPKDKQKISAQFSMLSGSAKRNAIYNLILSQMDQIGGNFSSGKKEHQSVDDLIIELDEKNPTPRSAALKKLGYSREDVEPYSSEAIDQIVAQKIKKGEPVPLLVALEKKRKEQEERKLLPKEKNKRVLNLQNFGYTTLNSKDMSKADLDWAIATNTAYGIPLPQRVFGATAEIAEKVGLRETLLRESRELFEKMKKFDGDLVGAEKLIDEQYQTHLELERLYKEIHEWTVDQQKERYEKKHKVGAPPTNLPVEEQK